MSQLNQQIELEQTVLVQKSNALWSETFVEKWTRRIRTYTSGVQIALVIRDKWGMKNPRFGATDPLMYAVNPNASGWHARINDTVNMELEPIGMKASKLDPARRYDLVRRELRTLPPRSKLALEARLTNAFGSGHDPVALVAELAGQPLGLPRLYGALTWNGAPEPVDPSGSRWGEAQPRLVQAITGEMLDDFLIYSLQTRLIAAFLRGK